MLIDAERRTCSGLGSVPEAYYRGLRAAKGNLDNIEGAVKVGVCTVCLEDIPQIILASWYVATLAGSGYEPLNAAIASLGLSALSTLVLVVVTWRDYRTMGTAPEVRAEWAEQAREQKDLKKQQKDLNKRTERERIFGFDIDDDDDNDWATHIGFDTSQPLPAVPVQDNDDQAAPSHFGFDTSSPAHNAPPKQETQGCDYSGPRGACSATASVGERLCTRHLCEKSGCGLSKSSRATVCSKHVLWDFQRQRKVGNESADELGETNI